MASTNGDEKELSLGNVSKDCKFTVLAPFCE